MPAAEEFRKRSSDELKEIAANLRAEIFNARFQKFTEQLEQTSTIKTKRRDLARVLTVLHERTLEKSDG